MRILAIETSEYVSSIALWDDGRVREDTFPSRMDLCEKLTQRIPSLLGAPTAREAGLDAIAVSRGPGSFTGLRVGMATAKALAHALAIPLVGVPTQEAIAAAAEVGEGERVLVLQNARRDHVYAGIWMRTGDGATEIATPRVVPNAELPALLPGIALVTGPATGALEGTITHAAVVRQEHAAAAAVARLAAERVGCAHPAAAFTLQPLYLLASQAERMKGIDVSADQGVGGFVSEPARVRGRTRLRLRRGNLDDLNDVVRIENLSFSSPWPEVSLRDELSAKPGTIFLVADINGAVAGYIGAWFFAGEAHICTLAVDPASRRCGLGDIMMQALLEEALRLDMRYIILEYRAGNAPAAELYRKFGFGFVHRRREYYQDNREDAIVAAIPDLGTAEMRARLQQLGRQWRERYEYEVSLDL